MNKFLNLGMRFISAKQIFSGKEFLSANTILVVNGNGLIEDITTKENVESSNIEHFEDIIAPGFINTHCHLELSHLKNIIKQHTGIVDFGLGVMKHRDEFSIELQQEAMQLADKEMQTQGIVAVGDISNTNVSIITKQESNLYYHTFVELIALNPERANLVFDTGKQLLSEYSTAQLSASLAPHAPYSASLELIKKITDDCQQLNKATSIHNQESKAENEFFNSKSGDYLRLYETIKVPIDYFKATEKSSLQTIISSFNEKVNTLLVHNTFTSKEDIEIAKTTHQQLYWCLCPNANLYIENTLPDIHLLDSNKCALTIGTDSLASNSGLSIINEINTILKHQPNTSLELLLNAATHKGAKFLGIENQFGLLEKNKKCGINLIEGQSGNYSVKKLA
jgi:cytosine/adenosine deaminase-related metal-dependent hydrolase